jgi:hypothetical protein
VKPGTDAWWAALVVEVARLPTRWRACSGCTCPTGQDKGGFYGDASLKDLARLRKLTAVVATFGDVVTVHKAQGSEWPRVVHERVKVVQGLHGSDLLRTSADQPLGPYL